MTAASSPQWSKSSYSGGSGTECVECAIGGSQTHVRDSKDTGVPEVTVGHRAWTSFVRALEDDRRSP